jgi:regulator of protease activity HflC (stomatin/prohibitin superfamily)
MFGYKRVVIYDYQLAVRYDYGSLIGVVESGKRWIRSPKTTLVIFDTRELLIVVPGQEVLTADGVTIKISLIGAYRIIDVISAVKEVTDLQASIYAALQVALRAAVGRVSIDELLAGRETVGDQLIEAAGAATAEYGVKLTKVDVRDVMFPGELKNVFAQVATARQEGLAALERARGETAALRNLANAARMADDNPHLLQLRMIQEISASSGNTFVVGEPLITRAGE